MDNAKYAYVMDEGYLRMMTLKERAKSGNGGKEWDYGTSAFYSCKFMRGNANSTAWASSNIRIYPGMRIETRARIRGMENSGMLPGIWLQGNEQVGGNAEWNNWPDFGEIDVMENNSHTIIWHTGAGWNKLSILVLPRRGPVPVPVLIIQPKLSRNWLRAARPEVLL